MSSIIGAPPNRVDATSRSSALATQAQATAQQPPAPGARAPQLNALASAYEPAHILHGQGVAEPETLATELALAPPGQRADGRAGSAARHLPQPLQQESTLAHRLEQAMAALNPGPRGGGAIPADEAADAQVLAFGGAAAASAARTRSLQQNQGSFVIPMALRRSGRASASESGSPGQQLGALWGEVHLEALLKSLAVGVGGGMHTGDDPALGKERRFQHWQRWLHMLAQRRRVARRRGKQRGP